MHYSDCLDGRDVEDFSFFFFHLLHRQGSWEMLPNVGLIFLRIGGLPFCFTCPIYSKIVFCVGWGLFLGHGSAFGAGVILTALNNVCFLFCMLGAVFPPSVFTLFMFGSSVSRSNYLIIFYILFYHVSAFTIVIWL